jgi:hypothetical protein
MSDPFSDLELKPRFPVVAVSRAGWTKRADEIYELVDASPWDDLREWQGLEIYDSAGQRYLAKRAFRGWPNSGIGLILCRVMKNSIHVALELDEGSAVSVSALKERLVGVAGMPERFEGTTSHQEVIERA